MSTSVFAYPTNSVAKSVARAKSIARCCSLEPAGARHLPVALHLDPVAVDVDRLAALLRELDGELEREAVRRSEREGLLARDRLLRAELLEEPEPTLERLEEPLLLEAEDTLDLVGALSELRVGVAHLLGDDPGQAVDVVRARSAAPAGSRGG